MGGGMATRLLEMNFPLLLFSRSSEKAAPFRKKGARVSNSLPEVACAADIIISVVSDDGASKAVWLGENGILEHARESTILVECSTLSLGWVQNLAEEAEIKGLSILDAPVTGSKIEAREGALRFLVGGCKSALARGKMVFDALGREVVHIGPTGSGIRMKLINNLISAIQIAATAEGVALAELVGLDLDLVRSVLERGAPGSPIAKTMLGRMINGDFACHFSPALMAKDLRYAIGLAGASDLRLGNANAALSLFDEAVKAGLDTYDVSSVIEVLRRDLKKLV